MLEPSYDGHIIQSLRLVGSWGLSPGTPRGQRGQQTLAPQKKNVSEMVHSCWFLRHLPVTQWVFMQQDKNSVHYMACPGEKHFKALKNNQRTSWKPKKNLYETLGNHMKPLGGSKRLSGLEDAVSYEYSSSSPVGVPKVEPSSGWCSYSMRKQYMSKKNLEINS